MTDRMAIVLRTGGKLLAAGALVVVAAQVSGLPSRQPPTTVKIAAPAPPVAAPVAHPAPLSVPSAAAPANDAFIVKRILDIAEPLHHGDYVWDDKGVPDGPLVITVDIAAETLSVFRDGYEIGTAVILFGADNKPTPLGVFPITQKDATHVSNLYDAPMPYMLRLTNDGVAIHGSEVAWDAATRGCIGVPVAFAKLLFAQARIGDRVFITNGKRLNLGEAIAT